MKGVKQPFGYTIVEVLIVLAVSGVMFVIAANFISGKQEKTAFQQGSNETVSRAQGLIGQVTDGQFTDYPVSCTKSGGSIATTGGSGEQGANYQCVFLGKMMHFSLSGKPNEYEVLTLAGARLNGDSPPLSIAESAITPISSLTSKSDMPQNLDVVDMRVQDAADNSWNETYVFGLMQGLGSAGTVAGSYSSGAQTVNLIYARGVLKTQGTLSSTHISPSTVKAAKAVCIALWDGTRGARVYIGADNGSQLSVSVRQLGVAGSPTCP